LQGPTCRILVTESPAGGWIGQVSPRKAALSQDVIYGISAIRAGAADCASGLVPLQCRQPNDDEVPMRFSSSRAIALALAVGLMGAFAARPLMAAPPPQ